MFMHIGIFIYLYVIRCDQTRCDAIHHDTVRFQLLDLSLLNLPSSRRKRTNLSYVDLQWAGAHVLIYTFEFVLALALVLVPPHLFALARVNTSELAPHLEFVHVHATVLADAVVLIIAFQHTFRCVLGLVCISVRPQLVDRGHHHSFNRWPLRAG